MSTSPGSFAVEEGETPVAALTATDDDTAGGDLVRSTVDGAAEDAFSSMGSGVSAFDSARVSENPDDGDADGNYGVTVQAGDGGDAVTSEVLALQTSSPTFPSTETGTRSVEENTTAGQDIGDPVSATDADPGDSVTHSLGGPDAASFDIDGATGQLRTKGALDHEAKPAHSVTVIATDMTGRTGEIDVTITVVNIDEPGTASMRSAQSRVREVQRAMLVDPDGVEGRVSWLWARSQDRVDWTNISGATQADYMASTSDQGNYLQATATYTDGHGAGKTASVTSDAAVGERESAPDLSVETVVSSIGWKPWGITFAPDGTMLFTNGSGAIARLLVDGSRFRVLVADLSDVAYNGNSGVMGIVVDPDFGTNRRFYTCQGHTGPVVQVIAWTVDATYRTATRVADPLVDDIASGGEHNGCRLRFGPDGFLWIATGDTDTTGSVSQDLTALGGKVLRVDSTTGAAPADNPFPGSVVYTYGQRNVQGLARRPGTDQMWSVEHGPMVDDEINLLVAGGNYGWDPKVIDGDGEVQPGYDDSVPMTDLVKFPDAVVARWSSGDPTLATSGGIFLEGGHWGAWEGRLVVATLKDATLHVFEFEDGGAFMSHVIPPELQRRYGRLRTPMMDPSGALYVAQNGGPVQRILRVTPEQAPVFPDDTTTAWQVPENAGPGTVVAMVEATDLNRDSLIYTLTGADAASFEIPTADVGRLRPRSTTRLDYETRQEYVLTVTATDEQGTSDSVELTITVTDVVHEGSVTLPSTHLRVGNRLEASLSDPDGGVTDTVWTWARSNDGLTGWETIDGAASASYTPSPEDLGMYLRATAAYTNTHGPGKTARAVTASAVSSVLNADPEFPSAATTRTVREHTAPGQDVGEPVAAQDPNDDAVKYTLSGPDAGAFAITNSSGQLLVSAPLDYETRDEYQVVVSVSDGLNANAETDPGIDDSVTVTVRVANVDEAGAVSVRPEPPRVSTVLRATLSDPDGVVGGVSWQWARSPDRGAWTDIDAAAGARYVPTPEDQGRYLRATAAYDDDQGSNKTAHMETGTAVGGPETSPAITVTTLVSGLSIPWGVAFAPDGTMLFTQRGGVLASRLTDGTVQTVSAGMSDLRGGGEAGLMAIAVDPGFASNRRFYTCQSHSGNEVQVIAWTIDAAYASATRESDPLVGGIPGSSRHNGCRLRFGPDRHLWIATGDAASGTAPQDPASLGGKVLRVVASTGAAAPGNPSGTRVYTYGHRNPQGLARRPGTNQMWVVEHGPSVDDEINLLTAGGNYGWNPVPGYNEHVPMTDLGSFPNAVEAKWTSGDRTLATSGGIFLEGAGWRNWNGRLAVAALKDESLRIFRFAADGTLMSEVVVPEMDGAYGRLRTPVLGPDGALYVTTANGGNSDRILRVVPSPAPEFQPGSPGAGGVGGGSAGGGSAGGGSAGGGSVQTEPEETEPEVRVPAFSDVRDSAWYGPSVQHLARLGVVAGFPDGTYRPDHPVNRAQMATFLVGALGLEPVDNPQGRFTDVAPGGVHASNIERIAAMGITRGCGDGTEYCPAGSVTRAQMAVFLQRAFALEPADNDQPTFDDVSQNHYAYEAVEALNDSRITTGCRSVPPLYCPNGRVTRAQMAVFLTSAITRVG